MIQKERKKLNLSVIENSVYVDIVDFHQGGRLLSKPHNILGNMDLMTLCCM